MRFQGRRPLNHRHQLPFTSLWSSRVRWRAASYSSTSVATVTQGHFLGVRVWLTQRVDGIFRHDSKQITLLNILHSVNKLKPYATIWNIFLEYLNVEWFIKLTFLNVVLVYMTQYVLCINNPKYVNEKLGIPSRSRYMNRENRMLLFAYSSGHNYSNKFIS